MRYIGNKANIIEKIHQLISQNGVEGESFFDFFSGTTNVARFYKKLGYKIFSSDILYLSFCLQKAYIENNDTPKFEKLLNTIEINGSKQLETELDLVVEYLNTLVPQEGFIYGNYTEGGTKTLDKPRMYFSDHNGKKIDSIRGQIEKWNDNKLLTESEYYILLACLVESVPFYANIAGVYAAFQKKWDPRALKPFVLRTVEIISNNKHNSAFLGDSVDLCSEIDVDILYLDPPYNERQYAPNYHLLETIARNDAPEISGITGMRKYDNQKSKFCNRTAALVQLERVASTAKYKYLVLSYNSEGIMPSEAIVGVLERYGVVRLEQFEYLRFKSNSNGESRTKKHIYEQLYILKKRQL